MLDRSHGGSGAQVMLAYAPDPSKYALAARSEGASQPRGQPRVTRREVIRRLTFAVGRSR